MESLDCAGSLQTRSHLDDDSTPYLALEALAAAERPQAAAEEIKASDWRPSAADVLHFA